MTALPSGMVRIWLGEMLSFLSDCTRAVSVYGFRTLRPGSFHSKTLSFSKRHSVADSPGLLLSGAKWCWGGEALRWKCQEAWDGVTEQ